MTDHRCRYGAPCDAPAVEAHLCAKHLSDEGPAPFVKVTEVEGRLYEFEFSNGSCYAIKGGPLNVRLDLADLAPPETISREWPAEGPPGSFRITVEFTPAGPDGKP